MSDLDRIDQRLAAVERAVIDGDFEVDGLADLATLTERLEQLDDRLGEFENRIAALEGQIDAVGGVVGNIESVNEDVETQADAAIAAVDRLEYRIEELERAIQTRACSDHSGEGSTATQSEPALPDAFEAAASEIGGAETGTEQAGDRTEPTTDRTESATDRLAHTTERTDHSPVATGDASTASATTAGVSFDETEVEGTAGDLLDGSTAEHTSSADRGLEGNRESTAGREPAAEEATADPTADSNDESDGLLEAVRARLS